MEETKRIAELYKDLYNGEPWIDVTITDTLKNISFIQANKKAGDCNSIWQIVEHMIAWRHNVIKRVSGETNPSDDQNYIFEITNPSAEAWKETLHKLADSQKTWLSFLEKFADADFEKVYKPTGLNYYKHIHGIIQHDAYHLGQIVVLAKLTSSGNSIPVS